MRVIYTAPDCSHGGVANIILTMQAWLRERGHDARLFCFRPGNFADELGQRPDVHIGPAADLVRLADEWRPDVLHTAQGDWRFGAHYARLARSAPRLLTMLQGQVLPVWTSRNCDGIAACSAWHVPVMRRNTDLPVRVIYNGIDTGRFTPEHRSPEGPPVIAWVGRADCFVQKNIYRLAHMAAALQERGYRLWVASPSGPEVVRQNPAFGELVYRELAPRVERWEPVKPERMPEFLRAVAASGGLVLSTSASEGLPLTLLEAQACGVPVVATDVRGNNEAVLPEHGGTLYAESDDPSDVVARIATVVDDRDGWLKRSEQAAALAHERFSLTRMFDAYLDLYQELPLKPSGPIPPRHYAACLKHIEAEDYRALAGYGWQASEAAAAAGEAELARRLAGATLRAAPVSLVRQVGPARLWRRLRPGRPAAATPPETTP